MRNVNLLILLFACSLFSCRNGEPNPPYVYETNPHYAFGYQELYGDYYANYGYKNNTLSLSLFSDSLSIDSTGSLKGFGQYLFLEDVFVAPAFTSLQPGNYTFSNTGNPFTVFPGKNDTIDNVVYTLGAYVTYHEKNAAKSTLKLITGGSFTVTNTTGDIYTIVCDFTTADSLKLKGSFRAELPQYDQALKPQKTVSPVRRRQLTELF